jgi:hypothetical protein
LTTGKSVVRRRDLVGPGQQYGDVEMLFEQGRRLDRALVASIDEQHARAFELHKRDCRHRLGGSGGERRHLRAGFGGIG